MTINTEVQSTSDQTPEEIKEKVEGAAGEMKEKAQARAGEIKEKVQGAARHVAGRVREMKNFTPSKNVIGSTLAMSGACIASVLIASAMRRGNPLESFSMMGEGLPFVRKRTRAYRTSHVLGGIGAIIGGSMLLAALNPRIGRRVQHRPLFRGALATLSAIGMDALMMGPSYIGKLVSKLGPGGTALKYGAIGSAYSLASRGAREERAEHVEPFGAEAESAGAPPVWSGAEVGTVAGAVPERPQPIV